MAASSWTDMHKPIVFFAPSNPHTTIIGYMTGWQRAAGGRVPTSMWSARAPNITRRLRLNAHPWRLDLDWRWHQAALDFGWMMSINPDAHSIRELDHMSQRTKSEWLAAVR